MGIEYFGSGLKQGKALKKLATHHHPISLGEPPNGLIILLQICQHSKCCSLLEP